MHAKVDAMGGVEVEIEEYGGAYDGASNLIDIRARVRLSPEEAYKLARELCAAANAEIERLTDPKHDGFKPKDLRGPYIVVPARKMTEEERAARETATGSEE